MNETVSVALAVAAGLALGAIFFGGLWWTVSKGLTSTVPALWFFVSLAMRMSLVLVGFYFVGHGNWQRMLFCLLGFVMARIVVDRLTRTANEAGHASQL